MSIPFKNDDRPYQMLHYCDKLLGGPGLDKDLAQAFFCAAGVDDVDLVVRALQYWLTNRREFPKPADIAAIAPTCTGGVTYQFLEDDRPRHICCPSCRVALDEIHQAVTVGAPLRVVPGQ